MVKLYVGFFCCQRGSPYVTISFVELPTSKIRRTQYLIAKGFQLRFAFLLSIVGIVVTAVVGIILFIVLAKTQTLFLKAGVVSSPDVIEFVRQQRSLYMYSLLSVFVGVTVVLLMLGIFVSHRLAGPIFALSRRMNDVAQGNFTVTLHLRKTDEFQELKDKFNTLVKGLQNQVKGELIKVDSVIESLKKVLEQRTVSGESAENLRSAFIELQSYYNYKKHLIEPPPQNYKPSQSAEDEVLV